MDKGETIKFRISAAAKAEAEALASARGVSVGELLRQALRDMVATKEDTP